MEKVFERKEDNFFIPESDREAFLHGIHSLTEDLGLEKEKHEFETTRTMYFLPNEESQFPRGFSVRYRDYAKSSLTECPAGEGGVGCYEIKYTDDKAGRTKKLKVEAPFLNEIGKSELKDLIFLSDARVEVKDWFMEKIDLHVRDNERIKPLAAVSYKRSRYTNGTNVFSIDEDFQTFKLTEQGERLTFIKTGDYNGLICEVKEKVQNPRARWKIYRALVRNNADRFDGKRGEALNKMFDYIERSMSPLSLKNEFPNSSIDKQLELLNPEQAPAATTSIYQALREERLQSKFFIAPDFPTLTSHSAICIYFNKSGAPDIISELKLSLGEFQYISPFYFTPTKPYTRKDARKATEGYKRIGKVARTRNSFRIYSSSNRCYEIAIDIYQRHPRSHKQIFSQIYIQYKGALLQKNSKPEKAEVEQEVDELRSMIINVLAENNLLHKSSRSLHEIFQNEQS